MASSLQVILTMFAEAFRAPTLLGGVVNEGCMPCSELTGRPQQTVHNQLAHCSTDAMSAGAGPPL